MKTGNKYYGKTGTGRGSQSRIMYDARGNRIKSDPFSNKYVRFLLIYALPYLVINGIILMLVCSQPKITVNVKDTNDYIQTEVDFTVKSLLPVKELKVSLESEPVEYEKSGSSYKCIVDKNGTFTVEAKSLNGMIRSVYTDVNQIDDSAPSIDESSIDYSRGELSFTIGDTLSGVDYDSLYGELDNGERIDPHSYDAATGSVTMLLPKTEDSLVLHYEDMVGNAGEGRVTLSVAGSDNKLSETGGAAEGTDSAEETSAGES